MPTEAIKLLPKSPLGEVALVGSGPGDPDLLTLKAWRIMQSADIVIYDRLVSQAIMDEINPKAERLYVGKETNNHCVPQENINALLIKLARQGKKVLRLKAGDPYIFGRGGEEAQELAAAGIPFQVVPGITAAAGAGTYCGIPLTHRDCAHSVTFITAHLKQNDDSKIRWENYLQAKQTLVIYMGLGALDNICAELIEHKANINTPIAVIYRATQPEEQVVCGTLGNICERVKQAKLTPPAITIIGDVVKLREDISSMQIFTDNQLTSTREQPA